MEETIEELVIEVRATTEGFASDMAQMRSALDTTVVDGFERAGTLLERGLLSAIRKGSLGFEDLKRAAFQAIDQIAAQALQSGLGSIFGSGNGAGFGGFLGGALGALFGLPGRATGGPVAPGRGYLIGERGPEVFMPTSAGRIEPLENGFGVAREVNVAIRVNTPAGTEAPTALKRSSRQLASAVRRAMQDA